MKGLVYDTTVVSEMDLVARISIAAARIREMPGVFEDVRQSMSRRCRNRDYYKNVGASRFNALYGQQGCILTRTFESNQAGRFDGRIIGKLEEGRSVTSVAAESGIAHSIVSRLWRQFQTTGTAIRGFSSGRPRGTTPADDRYIVLQARRNRRQTAGEIARHTTQATGRPISRFTVARRLHGGGLFARRLVRCVPLTPAHRRRRSLWYREHRNWRDNEWGRVFFTDESRFSLSSDSHRILIWRERGSRNHPSNIIGRDRYGGRGVLVWGGIMLGSRTDLRIFDAGSVNGTRYCNEIFLPYVRLFRGAMGLQFLFMDDNAPYHRTVAAEQLLESEDIERMDWPARSPDLNPIEHVWDFLGRRLAARTLPPVTIRELRLSLQDKWAAMPQQLIDTLILSLGRRCETCLAVRGDHIPY
ncbi:transposable element Tcb2 transposase [Trichonephila clavipes]|nr:transposable element Tcb2 transposase [Trichonephila clavipes]